MIKDEEVREMVRCGDCSNFLVQGANSAANIGLCKVFLDADGLGTEKDIYMDASKCPKFAALDRVRTNVSEFMWNPNLRTARGFDEK
ncbi:MAG: hypothetical protein QMD03_04570 [Syntrophales bacterium]|nr:hypothetical protein [Syntrophales bacterium]